MGPEPVGTDGWCGFPGEAARRCPGYRPGLPWAAASHLAYIPLAAHPAGELPGCAHLVAVTTSRGGFRGGCGHPDGNPALGVDLLGRRAHGPRISPEPVEG